MLPTLEIVKSGVLVRPFISICLFFSILIFGSNSSYIGPGSDASKEGVITPTSLDSLRIGSMSTLHQIGDKIKQYELKPAVGLDSN